MPAMPTARRMLTAACKKSSRSALVLFVVVGLGAALFASAEPAHADSCHQSYLSNHTKQGSAVWQDWDGVWHGVRYSISLSTSVRDRCQVGWVAADYGVTGKYLSNAGLGWTERFYYYNPADGKYHQVPRQYSSIQNPWHLYHDEGYPYYLPIITKVKVVLGVYNSGSLIQSTTMVCNPTTNYCS